MKTLAGSSESHQEDRSVDAIHKEQERESCNNCGKQHPRNKCPAYGTLCQKCGKANHWQSVCRSSKRKQFIQGRKPVFKKSIHTIEDRGDEDNDEILTISTIEVNTIEDAQHSTTHDTRDEVFATLEITQPEKKRKINLQCKVDTGAQSNVLPIRLLRIIAPEKFDDEGNLKPEVLEKNEAVLSAYGGSVIKQLGTINISCKYKEKKINCIFYVTDTSGPAILGLKACIALKLVSLHCTLRTNQSNQADPTSSFNSPAQNPGTCKKSSSYIGSHVPLEERPSITSKQELMDMYPECFNGTVGCFDDYTYHITLDPEVSPVVHAPRKVPIELKDKLQAELREMESQDIIAKVTQPTDWVNSLVIREKENGRLRLCLDPKDLNKAIKREHHPIPTLQEITPKLSGAKLFSKLDARNGYWNVKLDDESSYLTTFNTPFGRYRFLRMPFGLRMSQDIFQFKIDETYRDCLGAIGIADDVTVYGKNDKEHDLHLHETMERTRQAGIKLNDEKCVIKTKECNFFGMLYTPDGVKPSPEKVRAIESLEPPKDKKELHTFLGMATYMSSFIPNLADHTAPLRNLLKENADFTWNPSHSKAFEKVKALICTTTTLAYYDRNEPVVLHVDASIKGLGAVLFQNDKPIAFASKALTPAETRYANIERELLAVVYGCEKFHSYLYGRSFVVKTNHRPLEQIHKKNLMQAPPRLQRMLLRLQPYDCVIKYLPGREMVTADALSRLSPLDEFEVSDMNVKVHHLIRITPAKMEEFKKETAKDETLQLLAHKVMQGWPDSGKKIVSALKPYWPLRDDISVEDGLILLGSRVIVPESLRGNILQQIHGGHFGMEKCKLRAKSCVYWPGIYKEIENLVNSCCVCQKYHNSQQKEPMIPTEIPSRPWKTLSADLFYVQQSWFLIVVDYYSKFPFVKKLQNLTSGAVVNEMKMLFAENGIPESLQCDNGTQFTSGEFHQLARQYGFEIVASSPHYPRGHGFVERQVQTVKKTILKCRESKEDIDLALLALRTTPLSSNIPSPAELLNGRVFKSTLPGKIQPSKNQEEVRNWLKARQDNQCHYYNRHTKELPELHRDQAIYVQDPVRKTWNPARVIDQGETPRSYLIETGTGAQLRRNRIHLRPNNASNNSANNSSDCVSQRSMTAQYSSAILRESTAAGNSAIDPSSGNLTIQPSSPNPQCSSVTGEAEKGPRKSRVGREIRAPERLNL